MILYLLLIIVCVYLFFIGRKHYLLEKFRINLSAGQKCLVIINNKSYKAEIDAIVNTTIYVIIYNDGIPNFNNRVHISEIFPYEE